MEEEEGGGRREEGYGLRVYQDELLHLDDLLTRVRVIADVHVVAHLGEIGGLGWRVEGECLGGKEAIENGSTGGGRLRFGGGW